MAHGYVLAIAPHMSPTTTITIRDAPLPPSVSGSPAHFTLHTSPHSGILSCHRPLPLPLNAAHVILFRFREYMPPPLIIFLPRHVSKIVHGPWLFLPGQQHKFKHPILILTAERGREQNRLKIIQSYYDWTQKLPSLE